MEEKELKTSPKQRFFIILIAVLMLGSIIASYAAIVISGSQGGTTGESTEIDDAKVAEYEEAYNKIQAEFTEKTKDDYAIFSKYLSEVKGYNESAANEDGVKTRDLAKGSGDKVGEDNYLAYYVGWCADETVFDSSFDDNDNPTGFAKILDPSLGMIEGWDQGVSGMRLGGVREITVPGELAYGDQMEICGGYNKPLKFIVMAVENTKERKELSEKLDEAYMRYEYAQYGVDYDEMLQSGE
ncbi:FKBP-type peptidyl-prolyl cis-trans isomerase [Candidatus Saccharibacteria bacterium]|nr:FKBP-type peptidyl-prolyl cis-trans isomerase [Candidatus Saccharibacteria bacterium]